MNQNQMDFDIRGDEVREECGVFGIYDFDGNDVAPQFIMACLLFSTEDRKAAVLQSVIQKAQKEK